MLFVQFLREYMTANHTCYGTVKALKALTYVHDFSNSPMETRLAMFSVLPEQYGGCDFGNLMMNKAIPLTTEGRNLVGLTQIRGDLVFDRTIVEYNSNAVHLNSSRYMDDMNRKTAATLAGYNYIVITAGNIKNFYSFMSVMNAIAMALKRPPLAETPERKALYFRLFQ